jgi:hypothetical protein
MTHPVCLPTLKTSAMYHIKEFKTVSQSTDGVVTCSWSTSAHSPQVNQTA